MESHAKRHLASFVAGLDRAPEARLARLERQVVVVGIAVRLEREQEAAHRTELNLAVERGDGLSPEDGDEVAVEGREDGLIPAFVRQALEFPSRERIPVGMVVAHREAGIDAVGEHLAEDGAVNAQPHVVVGRTLLPEGKLQGLRHVQLLPVRIEPGRRRHVGIHPRERAEAVVVQSSVDVKEGAQLLGADVEFEPGIGEDVDAPVTEAMRDALRFELYRLFEDVALTIPGSRGGTEGDIEYSPYKMLQFALASVVGTDSRASDEIEAIALVYSHIYGKKLGKRGTPEEIQKTTDEAMDDIDRIQKTLQKALSAFGFSTDLSMEEEGVPAEAKDVRDVYNMDPIALRSLAIEHKYDSVRDLLEDLRKFVERNSDLSDLERNDLVNEINEKINEYENTSRDQQLSETELTNTNGEEGAGRSEGESEPGAGKENQHRDDSFGNNAGGEVLQPLTENQLYHRLTAQYGFVKDNRKGKNSKGDKYKIKRVKRNGEIGDDFGNKQQGRTFRWEVSFGERGTLGFYPKEKTDDYYIAWVPAGTKEGGVVGLLRSTGVVEMGIAESVGVLSEISGKPLIKETAVSQNLTNPTIVETVASLFEREGSAMEPNASMEREPVVRFEPGSVDAGPNGETRLYNQRILFESPETDPVQTAVSIPVDSKGRFGGPSEAVISAKVDGELREIGRITMDGTVTFNDDAAVYRQDNDGLFDVEGKKGTANELFPSLFENKSVIPSEAAQEEESTTEEKRSIIDIMGSEYKAKAKEQITKPC